MMYELFDYYMTIWARKSLFEELFGSKWSVDVSEENNYIVFTIKPKRTAVIELDSYKFDNIVSKVSEIGADEGKIYFGDESGFIYKVHKNKVAEDYNK